VAKNSYAVLGLGSFGKKLAAALSRDGNSVLACDIDPQIIDEMRDIVTDAVIADVSNENVLKELNISKFDAVILSMSSHFEDQVLALTLLKQEGAKRVIVKSNSAIQERILYKLGADDVLQPELDVAERLSRRLTLTNISDIFEFKGSAIAEVTVPAHLSGQELHALNLRNKYNVTILLMRKAGAASDCTFGPRTVLEQGDQLTVFGDRKSILEVFKEK
jgi:trk system potassium uptake protein TrkA